MPSLDDFKPFLVLGWRSVVVLRHVGRGLWRLCTGRRAC